MVPVKKTMGRYTIKTLTVITSIGKATSLAPSAAACLIGFPSSMCRWMFSSTTMELSTRVPTAKARPPRVMMLIVCPVK